MLKLNTKAIDRINSSWISGEKRQEKKEDSEKIHRVERTYGRFSRSIALPDVTTEEDIKASINNGVLELKITNPSAKETSAKKITIHWSQWEP